MEKETSMSALGQNTSTDIIGKGFFIGPTDSPFTNILLKETSLKNCERKLLDIVMNRF